MLRQERDRATQYFCGSDIQQQWKVQTFGLAKRTSRQIPFFSGTSQSPRRETSEEGAWSAYYNNFEKSEREYFLSKHQIYNM